MEGAWQSYVWSDQAHSNLTFGTGKTPFSQVETRLKCSAEQFKWLWAIRGIVEKIMLRECRTVAETFVGYCSRLAAEGDAMGAVRHTAFPLLTVFFTL